MASKNVFDFSGADVNPYTLLTKPSSGGISGNLKLASHILLPASTSTDSWGYDAANSYTNDQWVKWTVGAVGGKDFGGVLQMSAGGNGYYTTAGATTGNIDEYEVTTGGTFSLLTSVGAQTYALSDHFYKHFAATGAITLYRGDNSSGTLILTANDATPLSGGKPGFGGFDGTGGASALELGDDSVAASGGTLVLMPARNRLGRGPLSIGRYFVRTRVDVFAAPPPIVFTMAVDDASNVHTADAVVLTLNSVLTVADSSHDHTAESPSLTIGAVLTVADASHDHTADGVTVTLLSVLAIADASHDHTAENVTLFIGVTLVVADASHDHTADSLVLAVNSVLAVADASHTHTAESPSLTIGSALTVADASHGHTADALVLTVTAVLTVADASHAQSADSVALTVGNTLTVANASHGHTADGVVLTVASVLTVADASHGHTAESPTLTVGNVLIVADASHTHAADGVTLTLLSVLAVADASHGHTADNVALTLGDVILLVVADAAHGHTAESPTLTTGSVLVVADASHAHTAEAVVINLGNVVLIVADASHVHTADNADISVKPTNISEIIPYILNSLVGGRVWESATPDDLPRDSNGSILPFVVWTLSGGQDSEYVEQTPAPSHTHARVQLHSVAPGAIVADILTKSVRDAMLASDYTVGVYGSPVGTYDAARKLRGRFQQFSVWFRH